MPHIRRLGGDEWQAYRSVRLEALADSPDAFARTLDFETARPDAEWESRVALASDSALDLPLVLDDGERLAGLAWGKILPSQPDTAHLFQMWVAPRWRGHGFGAEMITRIGAWASKAGALRLVLGVTEGNTPARRLYARAGFVPTGEVEPLRPGSALHCETMHLDLRRNSA
jgi:GNAT superfamily N-acetyltransferase